MAVKYIFLKYFRIDLLLDLFIYSCIIYKAPLLVCKKELSLFTKEGEEAALQEQAYALCY